MSWLFAAAASAQGLGGSPLMRHFSPRDYNATPSHWAVATDREGHVFIGNAEGVLRYDGVTWTLIELPGHELARAVTQGADHRMYVGGYDTFGWLEELPDGTTVYRELMTAAGLRGEDRYVGSIWQVVATGEGVYFRCERALHFLSYDHKRALRWPMAEDQRSLYAIGNELYARIAGVGFTRFVDGQFVLEPGGEVFGDKSLPDVLGRPGWRLLVGEDGLYRADSSGIRPLADDAGAELRGTKAYVVSPLPDQGFVVGSLKGDLFRFGADYKLRDHVVVGSTGITALGTDAEGGLWVGMEGDLIRMSMPSPWSFIGSKEGLRGNPFDFDWYEGSLWLATSLGLAKMTPNLHGGVDSKQLDWTGLESFAVFGTDQGLLIAHRTGVLVLDKGTSTPRSILSTNSESVTELIQSRFDPGRAYAIGDLNLYLFGLRNGQWQLAESIPLEGASASSLLELAPGELWFADSRGGPHRWTFDATGQRVIRRQVFGDREGLRLEPEDGSYVYLLDGRLHATSGSRGFVYDGSRFSPEAGGIVDRVDRPSELLVQETPLGAYAYTPRQLWFRPPGQAAWQMLHFGSESAVGFGKLRFNRDNVLRVSTWTGLLQFDPRERQPASPPLALGFEVATAQSPDGKQLHRLPLASRGTPTDIPAGSRLHFRYSLVSLESEPSFRYRLSGPETSDPWSEWGDRDLSIRAIFPGTYTLQVEARTRAGRMSEVLTYRYRVLPYWYERWWVRALALLLLAAVATLATRWAIRRRTRRLRAANLALEAKVAERTSELQSANAELVKTNEELRESREEVISSGMRADLIFKALNDALAGTVLDGHYRLEAKIGSGGFGTVYRATQVHMDSRVAVKVFKPIPGHDAKRSMDRFRSEGLSAFRVNHPNAVRVLDFGISMDAVAYLVMEYLEGESLAERLAAKGPMPPRRVVSIIEPIAAVLAHAHEVGVIHRDVKPNNVLLCQDNDEEVVKLIDFGIAKVLDETTPTELKNLTATGLLMGTPNYMAPERFLDKPYDGRSDVYSLGIIAFELLAGRRPFADAGENYLPLAMQRFKEQPPSVLDVVPQAPTALAKLVNRMLARDPAKRPSAHEVQLMLATIEFSAVEHDPVEVVAASTVEIDVRADSTSVHPTPSDGIKRS